MNRDACYTLVQLPAHSEAPNVQTFKRNLERGTDEIKIETLQQIINSALNGENHEQLLMHIIRFVMPSKNKALKKMLLFYWEVCPKYNADGKLKQENGIYWLAIPCVAISSIPTNTFAVLPCASCASCETPKILEPLVDTAFEYAW